MHYRVRPSGDKKATRMREPIMFADVTLDSFMAEPDNELDFMVGEEELDQALLRVWMPRASRWTRARAERRARSSQSG